MMVVISLGVSYPLDLIGTRSVTPMLRRRSRRAAIADRMAAGHPQSLCGEADPLNCLLCAGCSRLDFYSLPTLSKSINSI